MAQPFDIVRDKVYNNESVQVDGRAFHRCTFLQCRIVFSGDRLTRFEGCVFDNCEWVFDEEAENTLQYLAYLYKELDQGGQEMIEGIFDSLRRGGVGHGDLAPTRSPYIPR